MPLNFPSNPSTGTQYASTSGITYVYDGRKWVGKAQTLMPGTNAITNNGYVVQVTNTGSLMMPVGKTIIDENGDPVLAPRGYTGSAPNTLNGQNFVTINSSSIFTVNGTTSTINDFYDIDSINFSDGTIQTRAARTNQDLYTTSSVTFASLTATSVSLSSILFSDGTIQTRAARTNQDLYTTSSVTFASLTATSVTASSITFGDGTVQTRAARTNQDLYTTSSVTFASVTATSVTFSDGTVQTRAARTNQDLYTTSSVTFASVTATSITFGDGTVQTRAARTNQDLYTTSTVTFVTVNANKFVAAQGPVGSVTAGYGFSSDLTSGMYSPSLGYIDFAVLGNTVTNLTTNTFNVTADLLPTLDNSFDLGSNNLRWKDSHISNRIYVDNGIYSANALDIVTNNEAYTWTFTTTNLSMPGGSSLVANAGNIDVTAGPNGLSTLASYNQTSFIWVDNDGAYVGTNWTGTNYTWTFSSNGGLIFPDGTTQTTAYSLSTLSNVTFADITSTGALTVNKTRETYANLSGATGVVTHNCNLSQIFYHVNVANTFTANFTNLSLTNNFATNVTLVINQGAIPYIADSVQIEGVSQNILWQGSLTAPSGNILKTDVMSFSIMSTGTNNYVVFGQLVSYG